MKNNSFKIIVPFYNVEEWIHKCIKSIKLQTYENFVCYLVDDISTDKTVEKILPLIEGDNRFVLIVNKEKKFALQNIFEAINQSGQDGEDIIVTLDGDDWFATKKALDILNEKYNTHNCHITYGSYIEYPSMNKGKFCRPINSDIVKNNSYRDSRWISSHLRTFKRHLWDNIDKKDLLDDSGNFYRMTWDMAFMFPMLEMAGPLALHIPDILYAYNRQNPLNDDKVNHQLQLRTETEIRSKAKYKQSFISCDILGPLNNISGLGNQLFCVATTLSYGIKNNKKPFFPQILTDKHIHKFKNNLYKNLSVGINQVHHESYTEQNFHYDEIPNRQSNLKLHGYFQSYKYFEEHREEILTALAVKELQDRISEQYGDYSDYTSLHIRRGDYLELSEYHHNLTLEYYKKAVSKFDKDTKFLIFSNDIDWCKKNLQFIKNTEFSEGKDDWEDMILMSNCKNNIIANSTFSWWGAWFNTNEDKLVVAPSKWFGPKYSNKNTKDVIPSSWEIL